MYFDNGEVELFMYNQQNYQDQFDNKVSDGSKTKKKH